MAGHKVIEIQFQFLIGRLKTSFAPYKITLFLKEHLTTELSINYNLLICKKNFFVGPQGFLRYWRATHIQYQHHPCTSLSNRLLITRCSSFFLLIFLQTAETLIIQYHEEHKADTWVCPYASICRGEPMCSPLLRL